VSRARTVLVADDDPSILRVLAAELDAAGYHVLPAKDGTEALAIADTTTPDVIVTDLAMPRRDGFAVIAGVRRVSQTPIIVLSVRGGESDKVRALDLGADDYVTKPVSLPELLARIRTQLRRAAPERPILRFPDLVLDSLRRRVTVAEREIRLTPREFSILELLAGNAGRPISAGQILRRVWGSEQVATTDAVRVHVSALRRKLEPDPSSPRYIVTEPWVGYRFIAEPLD
jgi:two-component system KDP operon response regulator KdpE